MAAPEHEVRVPGGDREGHSEAEWSWDESWIHVKKFADRYECFWYTDADRQKFVSAIRTYSESPTVNEFPEVSLTRVVTDDSETLLGEELGGLTELSDLSNYEFIEAELNGVVAYWKEEEPLHEDLPQFSQLVHVSGQRTSLNPLRHLFIRLSPEKMERDAREELIETVIDYIENSPDRGCENGTNNNG